MVIEHIIRLELFMFLVINSRLGEYGLTSLVVSLGIVLSLYHCYLSKENKMSLSLEKLCEVINQNFSEPYLSKDGVSAEIIDDNGIKVLSINIGRRDVQIDAHGEVVSCGTFLGMPNNTLVYNEDSK